ncbi:RING-H2 finger protein ATL2-like [Impatiens glandulifera]|uniref:RING-H2 finger protein ATL2-like n=1 Tax=Impatiens glandulifera TaxID=253017 RepID=UPI001FB13728|nr:RING-H2 finger protein ATL2-like [Impatiens glandulifera]
MVPISIVILCSIFIFIIYIYFSIRWYLYNIRHCHPFFHTNNIIFPQDTENPSSSSVLLSSLIPEFIYPSTSKQEDHPECSVCLSVFVEGDKCKKLPACQHTFHINCIDMWFYSHSTCPVCRTPVKPNEDLTPTLSSLSDWRKEIELVIAAGSRKRNESVVDGGTSSVPSQVLFKSRGNGMFAFGRNFSMNRNDNVVMAPSSSGAVTMSTESDVERGGGSDESIHQPTYK